MVMVAVTHTGALHRGESEARTDHTIGIQAPHADVAIPSRLHLADQDHFLPLDVDGHAEIVPRIGSGVEDGSSRGGAQTEPRRDICAVGLDHTFLPLPVAVRPTAILIILCGEDGNVSAVENPLTAVVHITELNAGMTSSGGGGRPDHKEFPQ